MSKFKFFLLIAACLIILQACSPQKRIERILKNNPYIYSQETITVRDTVIIQGIITDTTVITKQRDTVEIFKDRLYTRIIRDNDTLIVYSEARPDTIYLEKTMPVKKVKITNIPEHWSLSKLSSKIIYFFFVILAFMLLILYIAYRQKQ